MAALPTGTNSAADAISALPELVALDAVALSGAIRARRISCVEVMRATLQHIDRVNPKVNAIVALRDQDALLKQAAESDRLLARGTTLG